MIIIWSVEVGLCPVVFTLLMTLSTSAVTRELKQCTLSWDGDDPVDVEDVLVET